MFDLPKSTEFNKIIPKEKLFMHSISSPILREIYNEQISYVKWSNKISAQTFILNDEKSAFPELEIFDIGMNANTFDKRLLQQVDRAIPYYILHILNHENKYQAWIANKKSRNGKIIIDNYIKTHWLNEIDLNIHANTIDEMYKSICDQITENQSTKLTKLEQYAEYSDFLKYFYTMKMSRSYKPILILATLHFGGKVTVEQAAYYFIKYYSNRIKLGLKIENGNCIYTDEPENFNGIITNLIRNPINALCKSGFFEYDPYKKIFSFANNIYDNLSLNEIDEIIQICYSRLEHYFSELK